VTNNHKFYIDGKWVSPKSSSAVQEVINPATEEVIASIALGNQEDVDAAVAAAKKAFQSWSRTSRQERIQVLEKVAEVYERRMGELAKVVTSEMGAPSPLSINAHVPSGLAHIKYATNILANYQFESVRNTTTLVREPVGVCGLITPWNWPLNQILCKVAPAMATGCTLVLKPSEVSPLNALILAEIMDEAGVPPGVFNLVNGTGEGVGVPLSKHPDVDMISFTGSTRAGILVSKNASETVKRISLELGGKSANIILDDADLAKAAQGALEACFLNSGQTCAATTRLLVKKEQLEQVIALIRNAIEGFSVGDPTQNPVLGPLVNKAQFDKVQRLIQSGLDEGAELVVGGLGRPDGLERGYYVRPTVFAHVKPSMTIAREEIFGPVLVIIAYEDEDDAVRIANDSVYGLSGGIQSADPARAYRVASRMRTGMVNINGAGPDFGAPFGGYKQSGNGREWGDFGFEEFLEVKAVMGYQASV